MHRWSMGLLSAAGLIWMGCSSAVGTPGDGGGGTPGAGGDAPGIGGTPGDGGAPGAGGTPGGVGGTPGGVGGTPGGVGGTPGGVGGTPGGVGGTPGGVACTGAATNNGYIDNGTLCGFAWTGENKDDDGGEIAGQTIEPPCGTGAGAVCFTGATVCATATIPANQTTTMPYAYAGVMVGWNVAQGQNQTTAGNWTSSGAGITVNYTATGATGEIRVALKSGGTDYCAVVTASPATLTWADFSKECWEGGAQSPVFAASSPVTALLLQANGVNTGAQTVTALCLNSVTNN